MICKTIYNVQNFCDKRANVIWLCECCCFEIHNLQNIYEKNILKGDLIKKVNLKSICSEDMKSKDSWKKSTKSVSFEILYTKRLNLSRARNFSRLNKCNIYMLIWIMLLQQRSDKKKVPLSSGKIRSSDYAFTPLRRIDHQLRPGFRVSRSAGNWPEVRVPIVRLIVPMIWVSLFHPFPGSPGSYEFPMR